MVNTHFLVHVPYFFLKFKLFFKEESLSKLNMKKVYFNGPGAGRNNRWFFKRILINFLLFIGKYGRGSGIGYF